MSASYHAAPSPLGVCSFLPAPGRKRASGLRGGVRRLCDSLDKRNNGVAHLPIMDARECPMSVYFERVFGAELDGTRADKTELLDFALKTSKADRQHATMICDRSHDITRGPAERAGSARS
jgi:hypothetical protein